MIIRIPVQYSAEIRQQRRRLTEQRCYTTYADLFVQEVALEAAPVALWYAQANWHPSIAVRFVGDTFCEPVNGTDRVPNQLPGTRAAGEFVKTRKGDMGGFNLVGAAALPSLLTPPEPFRQNPVLPYEIEDDPGVAEVLSSSKEAVIAARNAVVSSLVVIGGVVHKKTGHPIIVSKGYYGALKVGSSSDRLEPGNMAFPITDLKRAKESLEERHDDSQAKIRILRPDLLDGFDFQSWYLQAAAGAALAHLSRKASSSWRGWGESELSTYPRNVLVAFAGVRDCLAGGPNAADLLSQLQGLHETIQGHGVLSELSKTIQGAMEAAGSAVEHQARSPQ